MLFIETMNVKKLNQAMSTGCFN